VSSDPDAALLDALRMGDEAAFTTLVRRHHRSLLRVAGSFVPSAAVAEEVVQDTWLAVVKGIERFEGRSSVRTWLFRILLNRARTTGASEPRTSSFDTLSDGAFDERFQQRFDRSGEWSEPPVPWTDRVDDRIAAAQLADRVLALLPTLPDLQRRVFVLHDVESVDVPTICDLLGITRANQRVLLHRARARLRATLEVEMGRAD
jgi:RNA polymerase sigma-70 factor (ECF subfamily)